MQNFGLGKCKTADKFWLVRRLRIFSCTGVRYCTQRENSGFTSSNMHLENPAFGQQKTPIKSGFSRNISFLCSFYGGGGESRTPVRKQLDWNFSGRSPLFTFPHPDGNGHPAGFGSFMMHGAGKAYRTHGLHSNHTRARLVDLPGRMGA